MNSTAFSAVFCDTLRNLPKNNWLNKDFMHACTEAAEAIFEDGNAPTVIPNMPTKDQLKTDLEYIKTRFAKRAITELDKEKQDDARKRLNQDCKWLSYMLANEDRLGNSALTTEEMCYFEDVVKQIADMPKPVANIPYPVQKDMPVETFLKDVALKCTAPKPAVQATTAVQTPANPPKQFWNIENMIKQRKPQPAIQR